MLTTGSPRADQKIIYLRLVDLAGNKGSTVGGTAITAKLKSEALNINQGRDVLY